MEWDRSFCGSQSTLLFLFSKKLSLRWLSRDDLSKRGTQSQRRTWRIIEVVIVEDDVQFPRFECELSAPLRHFGDLFVVVIIVEARRHRFTRQVCASVSSVQSQISKAQVRDLIQLRWHNHEVFFGGRVHRHECRGMCAQEREGRGQLLSFYPVAISKLNCDTIFAESTEQAIELRKVVLFRGERR